MSNPLLVGIDPHRRTNTVCLMDGHGRELGRRFTIANNRPGAETFAQQVAKAVEASGFDRIEVASEATGWYWFLFFQISNVFGAAGGDPGVRLHRGGRRPTLRGS